MGLKKRSEEEIEIWKDLGKLETQAGKFKPKLDKMQEKVVAAKTSRTRYEEKTTRTSITKLYEKCI